MKKYEKPTVRVSKIYSQCILAGSITKSELRQDGSMIQLGPSSCLEEGNAYDDAAAKSGEFSSDWDE